MSAEYMAPHCACPRCGSEWTRRIRRAWWMRLLVGSMRIRCLACHHEFLLRKR